MNKNEIIFVTHNIGKIKSAEKYFKNLKFSIFNYELKEPRSDDIKEIATAKVKEAFEIVKKPCIALDTDFRIEELNGFPRAFVNFSLDTIGINGILRLMEGKENRKCAFNECLAYHDGKDIHYFYGKHPGNLSEKTRGLDRAEKWSDLWYIFKPKDLIKHWQRWIQKKEKIEEKLMAQYKQCRNLQNGMKTNNHPYKLQVISQYLYQYRVQYIKKEKI